jgi:hypothetical protein
MHRKWFVAAALLPGCFLLPGSSHGLKGGETLYVAEDSQALQVMGDTLKKEDHRKQSHGQPLSVVAAGATVRVAKDYEQQRELNTNGAALANRNPWILVEVVDSPVSAQRGWKGWIHFETTKKQPVHAPAITNAELPRASLLCPYADANEYTCNLNLPANTAVRVVGCAGPRVQVELFTSQGLYINGFVNASQFSTAPCTTASKE